jgi:hypothetical protein
MKEISEGLCITVTRGKYKGKMFYECKDDIKYFLRYFRTVPESMLDENMRTINRIINDSVDGE